MANEHPGPEAVLHPEVLRHIARLGGRIPDDFAKPDRTEPTPVGERPVPLPVQALLSIEWPDGHVLHTAREDEEFEWLATFPVFADGDELFEEPRAWLPVAYDESQAYWVVDLDDADVDDPLLYRADHDGSDEPDWCEPVSAVLADHGTPGPPRPADAFPRACAVGDLAAVREFLAQGADPGPLDPSGVTPLHLAVVGRSPDVAKALLDAGADPNAATTEDSSGRSGWTYLDPVNHPALHERSLIPELGQTPLHLAVAHWYHVAEWTERRLDVIRVLLAAGADPDARDGYGGTPLLTALEAFHDGGRVEMLRLLLDAGADPHSVSEGRRTPAQVAAERPWSASVFAEAARGGDGPGEPVAP